MEKLLLKFPGKIKVEISLPARSFNTHQHFFKRAPPPRHTSSPIINQCEPYSPTPHHGTEEAASPGGSPPPLSFKTRQKSQEPRSHAQRHGPLLLDVLWAAAGAGSEHGPVCASLRRPGSCLFVPSHEVSKYPTETIPSIPKIIL